MEQSGTVEVRVRTLDGQSTMAGVPAEHTIADLKKLLRQSFHPTLQHFYLFLRGSKLKTGARIGTLLMEEDEFIVLIPFTKKKQPLNTDSVCGTSSEMHVTEKVHKQNDAACTRECSDKSSATPKYSYLMENGGKDKNILQSCSEGNSPMGAPVSESSGSHTAAAADVAWHDIMSDLAVLSASSELLQDVQCPTSLKSMTSKNFDSHENKEADSRREMMDFSLYSPTLLHAVNSEQIKTSESKKKRGRGINDRELVAGSAFGGILDERNYELVRQIIDSTECAFSDLQVDSLRLLEHIRGAGNELYTLQGHSNKTSEAKVDGRKRRKLWSYPPALQRLNKIFMVLNTVYGFLQKQHMQATWSNVKGALKQLCGFEEINVNEIEQLADLCPKVVVLTGKVGEGEELAFSIDLFDSSRLQLLDQLHSPYNVIPGGKEISNRVIVNAIAKRQKAYEANLLDVMKHWQESKAPGKNELNSVTLEDLIWAAQDMSRIAAKSSLEDHAATPLPRPPLRTRKQSRCVETNVLTPLDMVEHLKKGLGSHGQLVHVEIINPRKAKYGDPLRSFSETTEAVLSRMGISRLYSHQAEAISASLMGKNVVVATSTASGKSLCYNVPVLEELSMNPMSCALYLFPTKALAQDQLRALLEMTRGLKFTLTMGVYDGDTPQGQRMWLRDNARLLITNPDMLHVSILPSFRQFQRILSNLRFVIIDEAHAYKGAFGCHTALILRRMRRICRHCMLWFAFNIQFWFHTVQNYWVKFANICFFMNLVFEMLVNCVVYGADPVFIISSATAANPCGHAMELANLREVEVVQDDGSPCGSKLFLLWNPPMCLSHRPSQLPKSKTQKDVKMQDLVSTEVTGKRASPIVEASCIFAELVQHGLRCIAFCKTRKLSELVLNYTREILNETAPDLVNSICVYRAGYTSQDRRKIESDLFGGRLRGVAATNALELGVDVGNLDATLHLGFPGTVASLWQQAGRAGRREKASLSVYVAFEGPLDQHFMKYPHKLFSRPIEHSQVDAHNTQVIKQHIICAALEHPIHLQHDEEYFGSGLHSAILELMKKGYLGRHPNNGAQDESWYYIGKEKDPSFVVSIRAIDPEKYTVINQATNEVIEEIEESKAFFEVYEGGVYMHQGKTYLVKNLDLSAKVALCQQSDLKYYTKTRDYTDIHVIGGELAYPAKVSEFKYPATTAQANLCKVTTKWFGFRRIWRGSNQVFDSVDLFLPDYSYESQAVWIRVPHQIRAEIIQQNLSFRAGLHAACHALLNIMPLYIMCNPSDLGSECANPHDTRYFPERLLLYDRHPGGIGIAVQARPLFAELLQAALELVVTCECLAATGCPNCVQNFSCSEYNEVIDKQAAIIILKSVIQAEEVYREGNKDLAGASTME